MIKAHHAALQQNENFSLIMIRHREMSYFKTYYRNFGFQAAAFIGVVFTMLTENFNELIGGDVEHTTLYKGAMFKIWLLLCALSLAFVFNALLMVLFVMVCGPRQALHGEVGAMVRSVDGMRNERYRIFVSYVTGLALIFLMLLANMMFTIDRIWVIVVFVVFSLAGGMITYSYCLRIYNRFRIGKSSKHYGSIKPEANIGPHRLFRKELGRAFSHEGVGNISTRTAAQVTVGVGVGVDDETKDPDADAAAQRSIYVDPKGSPSRKKMNKRGSLAAGLLRMKEKTEEETLLEKMRAEYAEMEAAAASAAAAMGVDLDDFFGDERPSLTPAEQKKHKGNEMDPETFERLKALNPSMVRSVWETRLPESHYDPLVETEAAWSLRQKKQIASIHAFRQEQAYLPSPTPDEFGNFKGDNTTDTNSISLLSSEGTDPIESKKNHWLSKKSSSNSKGKSSKTSGSSNTTKESTDSTHITDEKEAELLDIPNSLVVCGYMSFSKASVKRERKGDITNWERFYFVLSSDELYYYKTKAIYEFYPEKPLNRRPIILPEFFLKVQVISHFSSLSDVYDTVQITSLRTGASFTLFLSLCPHLLLFESHFLIFYISFSFSASRDRAKSRPIA
jgi:hypothetical protein